jgi:hypothetical protein
MNHATTHGELKIIQPMFFCVVECFSGVFYGKTIRTQKVYTFFKNRSHQAIYQCGWID